MRLRQPAACAALLLLLTPSASRALPGALDPTFAGGAGKTRFGVWPGTDDCRAVAVQSDGKIVLAATSGDGNGPGITLIRLNTDGTPDVTFGVGGTARPRILPARFGVWAMLVQPDGRIVVVGENGPPDGLTDFAAARFTAAGVLDSTFDGDGCVITRFDNVYAAATAVALQADGKLVLAGYASDYSNSDFAAARYNIDGSPDPSFDGDGKLVTDMLTTTDYANAVALQADGKILLAGSAAPSGQFPRCATARYTTTGALDATFDGDGRAFLQITGQGDELHAVAIQSGGGSKPDKIVVAGASYDPGSNAWGFAVARYSLNGALDTTFDGDGKRAVFPAGRNNYGNALAIQVDRNAVATITVGGTSQVVPSYAGEFGVMRFTSSGALDTSLDGDGMAFASGVWSNASGNAMRVTSAGIVMAGTCQAGVATDIAVARFTASGALDATFNGAGTRTEGVGRSLVEARALALQADGKILLAGSGGAPRAPFELVRCLPDGGLDATFGTGGIAAGNFTPAATAATVLTQPDGRILVAGSVAFGPPAPGVVARYLPDGQLDASFGTGGVVTIDGDYFRAYATSLALQPDGKIVVGGGMYVQDVLGGSYVELMVVRLTANGSPDGTFGSGGRRLVIQADAAQGVAVDAVGRIVVACPLEGQFAVYRFNANGTLDTSFNQFGWAQTAIGTGGGPSALLIQPDGQIVVAGTSSYGFGDNVTLVRYQENGALDPGFGQGGIVVRDLVLGTDRAYRLVRQGDGHLLVAGMLTTVTFSEGYFLPDNQFAVAAFLPNGAVDTGYGAGGLVTLDVGDRTGDAAYGLALDGQGRAVVGGVSDGLIGLARLSAGTTSAVPDIPRADAGFRLGAPVPNPLRTAARVMLELPAPGRVTAQVVDVNGRLVRRLTDTELSAGAHALDWDGRDDDGRLVAGGIYFLAVRTPGGSAARRLVVIR